MTPRLSHARRDPWARARHMRPMPPPDAVVIDLAPRLIRATPVEARRPVRLLAATAIAYAAGIGTGVVLAVSGAVGAWAAVVGAP